jgi:hypothetical protein
MADKMNYFDETVAITNDYLGPPSERFVLRQIQTHLDKTPEELTKEDMPELIDWLKITMSVLTESPKLVHEYGKRLDKLVNDE